jgi:transposase
LILSPYIDIYDIVVPKDNLLRKINELIDFSFVYDELINKYCLDNGRNAISPIRMFKYLLLKSIFDLSDIDIVERSKYDMSFKYFLDMSPEGEVIDPSSLTKFRKMRLKDINLLDMLINKTVAIALEKGIIKSKSIIVDSTHTRARYNQKIENIKLVAKLNPGVTQGNRQKEDGFQFNKDAGMYVCKAGNMAIRKARQGKKDIGKNQRNV